MIEKIKSGMIITMVIAIVAMAQKWHADSTELARVQAIVTHPQIQYRDRVVTTQGPIQTKTVYVKTPGKTIIQKVVTEEPVTIEWNQDDTSTPVPETKLVAHERTDRYLVTFGLNRLGYQPDGKALFVGYGINNRLDVQVGAIDKDGLSPWILATARF